MMMDQLPIIYNAADKRKSDDEDLGRMWKETIIVYRKYWPRISREGLRKTMIPSRNIHGLYKY
jgi:hypothetical protein